MGRAPALSQESVATMRRLRLEGWTISRLADTWKVGLSTVHRVVRDVECARLHGWYKRSSESQGARILEALRELNGAPASVKWIAGHTGISENAVCSRLTDLKPEVERVGVGEWRAAV